MLALGRIGLRWRKCWRFVIWRLVILTRGDRKPSLPAARPTAAGIVEGPSAKEKLVVESALLISAGVH